MTLRISLRDGEKIVVNGAVLSAVGRTDLCVENNAAILRGREIMLPDEANTPARRLYFASMTAYLDPAGMVPHHERILACLAEVVAAADTPAVRARCVAYARHLAQNDAYRSLAECRALIDFEPALASAPMSGRRRR
jgi:flagellar protein FlbT